MSDHGDLIARARGLSGHLLRPEQYRALCNGSRSQVGKALLSAGAIQVALSDSATMPDIEWALRRSAAERLRLLARWAGSRHASLAPLLDMEEVQALRTLLRAIVTGVGPGNRMNGVVPTVSLPERALQLLAACPDAARFAALLVLWRNSFGHALAVEAGRAQPELLRLEVALTQVLAERARAARSHDSAMQLYISRAIDLANLSTALVLVEHSTDGDLHDLYVAGGRLMNAADLTFAHASANRQALSLRLQARLQGTPLEAVLDLNPLPDVEEPILQALIREFRHMARVNPTSLAPVILFVLRQRAELRALMRIVWSLELGVPAEILRDSVGVAA